MKKITAILLLASTAVFAQKKNLSINEAVLGLNTTLAVKNLKQLKWMQQENVYTQAIQDDQFKGFVCTDPKTNVTDTLLQLENLNTLFESQKLGKLTALPAVEWINRSSCYLQKDSTICYIQKKEDAFQLTRTIKLPGNAENLFYSNDKQSVAYTSNHQLVVQSDKFYRTVTNDGTDNLLYGTSVHRDEFGIDHGIFWSPKGSAIAFYRMDQRMVEDYPIVNWSETPATVKMIKYPFAGRTSHQVSVLIHYPSQNKTIVLKTGEPKEQYLTNVTWSPDEKYIYIQVLNREQNHMKLNQYDATNGELITTLFEESHERYVEPQHELYFINNTEFIYWSQRDGYMHLYKYNLENNTLKQITKGKWIVNEIIGLNKKTNELIYSSTEDGATEKHLYAVQLKNSLHERIDAVAGVHTATLSKEGDYLIDNYTSMSIPRKIDLLDVQSGKATNLLTAADPLANYQLATTSWKELKADDGTTLYGKLMLPHDFDANKKYPTIVYLYNGPHVQLNRNTFPQSGNLWYDYMTERGYIVFVIDGRGSSNRGFEFESATWHQLGSKEMKDQLVGINWLKSQPYVDAERMGIHGWSFGGFMTTSFMLREPNVFKVGVAGGPVLDWSMYEVMYTERYMGTPSNNAEGYQNNVLLNKVKNLKGKLLLIHGTDDPTVVWQHSVKILKQAVTDNIQLDYFVYPGYEHNVRGKDRVHLMQKISDYFDLYLKP